MSTSLLSWAEASREGIVSPSESREVDLEDRELPGGFGPLVTRCCELLLLLLLFLGAAEFLLLLLLFLGAAELLLLLLLFLRGGVGER